MKDFVRRCSQCGHNGHNSRTCTEKNCIKLFGVKIENNSRFDDKSIRRSKSLGSIPSYHAESKSAAANYLSDSAEAHDIRKGKPWTEDEHRCFLMGLEKLGKGDWRGISDQFVTTRTPTQVASHAQKYFHRMAHMEGKNRRCSIFDISINERVDSPAPKEQTANESRAESDVNVLAIKQHKENHKKSTETSTLVVASSERPPISPSMRYNASSTYPKMPYMVGPSSSATPTFSFLPMMSTQGAWPPPTFVYQPIQPFCNVKVAPYARPLMVVPASGPNMFPRQLQAAPPSTIVMPITKNDRLDLNVGALTL